jgi:hypothetical protein
VTLEQLDEQTKSDQPKSE